MLKRSFWLAVIVAPLCFSPACEMVADAVKDGALKGDNGSEGSGDGDDYEGKDGTDGTDGNEEHPSMCKPVDKEAAEDCMDPRWDDTDGDGCIDHYACGDCTVDVIPTECKPFPKEELADCIKPLIEDGDGDGCIDFFACLDDQGDAVGGPDDQEPTMCKLLPSTEGCAKPYFEDRDRDGCIDLYTCLDDVIPQTDLPATK